jgi:hypothetical protein
MFEFFAVSTALFAAISDVCGAEGQAFNFVLPLFGLSGQVTTRV